MEIIDDPFTVFLLVVRITRVTSMKNEWYDKINHVTGDSEAEVPTNVIAVFRFIKLIGSFQF